MRHGADYSTRYCIQATGCGSVAGPWEVNSRSPTPAWSPSWSGRIPCWLRLQKLRSTRCSQVRTGSMKEMMENCISRTRRGAGFTTWTTGCWRSFARPAHEPSGLLKNRMRDALFQIDQLFQKYRLGRLRLRPAHQSTAAILAESQAARWRQIVEPYRAPAIRTPIAQRRTVSRAYAEARQAPRPAIIRHALRQAARAVL